MCRHLQQPSFQTRFRPQPYQATRPPMCPSASMYTHSDTLHRGTYMSKPKLPHCHHLCTIQSPNYHLFLGPQASCHVAACLQHDRTIVDLLHSFKGELRASILFHTGSWSVSGVAAVGDVVSLTRCLIIAQFMHYIAVSACMYVRCQLCDVM